MAFFVWEDGAMIIGIPNDPLNIDSDIPALRFTQLLKRLLSSTLVSILNGYMVGPVVCTPIADDGSTSLPYL